MKNRINSLACFCGLLFILTVTDKLFAQNAPISQSANSMVNTLTGDFNYSIPVMTVPGPNGENVPITFSYSSGIRVEQQASWIGLGWGYNPGEISHNVKGISDDWKNKTVTTTTKKNFDSPTVGTSETETINYYGPLYYKDVNYTNGNNSMDIAGSTAKLSSGAFNIPDYDAFNVSGPGISGTMEARMFDYASYHMSTPPSGTYTYVDGYNEGEKSFSKSPNFIFTNDFNSSIVSPSSMVYNDNDFVVQFTDPLTAGNYSGAYNSTDNRAHSSYYIEYFTNASINASYSTLKANGFLDYRIISGTRRPTSEFDSDGIGAFRITTPSGMVYHYSLPVYNYSEKTISFILNSSFAIANEEFTEIIKNDKYAVSWKLTAITGLDYVDSNDNGIADIGDSGYWIAYNYGKWTDSFAWRYPFYNYKHGQYNKRLPTNYRPPSYTLQHYRNQGTVSSGTSQDYYLNSIQTGSHTAFFIKSVRLDAHSINNSGITPSLRLDKIILVRNEDIALFDNSGTLSYDNRFSLTNCVVSNIKPHIGNYNYNEAVIKSKSLQTVEMSYDYSLCKRIYNNINNSFTTTDENFVFRNSWSPSVTTNFFLYKKFDEESGSNSTTDNSNSGKLTLNELKIYGIGYKAGSPSYVFDYDKSNSTKNPNYSVFKNDWWGYYKSDFSYYYRGHHTSTNSKANTDAWSMKKITTPLGGEVVLSYESNVYRKAYNGKQYISPQRFFLINDITIGSPTWRIETSREAEDFYALDSVISKSVFIPYYGSAGGAGCGKVLLSKVGYNPHPIGGSYLNLSVSPYSTTNSTKTFEIENFYGTNYNTTNCTTSVTYSYSPLDNVQGWGYLGITYSSIAGGGTRVKSIALKDPETNYSYTNEYVYELGACGTEPGDVFVMDEAFTVETNKKAGDPYAPGSAVTYGKVTVKSKSLNNTYNGKTVYEYNNTFDPVSVAYEEESVAHNHSSPSYTFAKMNYQVSRVNGMFCSPKSTVVYDNNNNIISKTDYEYSYLSSNDTPLPYVKEAFHNSYILPNSGLLSGYDLVILCNVIKEEKQARLKRKISYVDGVKTIEEPKAWDGITGEVTKMQILDPTNGITIITNIPAYTQTAYASMGAKSVSSTNKNLPLLPYKSITERDKITRNVINEFVAAGNPEIVSGTKNTWQQTFPKRVFDNSSGRYITQSTSSSLWKPYKTYIYNGETNDANWREETEVTIFNGRNNVLETKTGVSNRYVSTKYGYDQKIILTQASDCAYSDFTFSSFEDQEATSLGVYFGGEISQGGTRYAGNSSLVPHSGNYVSKVDAGAYGPAYTAKGFTKGRSYRASVWVHSSSPTNATLVFHLDGTSGGSALNIYKSITKSDASNTTIGDWTLMTLTIDVPADFTETGGSNGFNDLRAYLYNPGGSISYFDDFMVRPIDSDITGNVVDEKTGRTLAVIDKYGFGVRYVYDDAGRVREVWAETVTGGWKMKTRYSYNFKRTY
jgi:hypothetical protein